MKGLNHAEDRQEGRSGRGRIASIDDEALLFRHNRTNNNPETEARCRHRLQYIPSICEASSPQKHSANRPTDVVYEPRVNVIWIVWTFAWCQLTMAKPKEISALLPGLLNCIRMIWNLSKFYNTEERLTGLLRKISNEVRD